LNWRLEGRNRVKRGNIAPGWVDRWWHIALYRYTAFKPPVQPARKPLATRLTTSRSQACAGWLSSRRNQTMAASIGLGGRDNRGKQWHACAQAGADRIGP